MKTVASVIALSLLSTGVFCQQKAQKKETSKAQTSKTAKKPTPKLNVKMRSNYHSKPTKGTTAQNNKGNK